ncbi:MAG TPA: glycosyltransferase, partial [bacterium]
NNRREALARFRNWAKGGQTWEAGLFSYVPLSLVPFTRFPLLDSFWAAKAYSRFTVPSLFRFLDSRGPFDAFLIGDPRFVPLIDRVKARKRLFRLTDDILGFTDTPRTIQELYREAVEKCERIIVTARPLKNMMEKNFQAKDVTYLSNGVDVERFLKVKAKEPMDLKAIPGPRAVYVGALLEWFDVELLRQVAVSLPKVSFILIGPPRVSLDRLKELSNVHILGPKPYESIPHYLSFCQVGLIPFKKTKLIQSVSPIKLYEYMACGLPVVSTDWEELRQLKSPAYLAKDLSGFIQGIRKALAARRNEKLVRFARKNSWDKKVDKILELIGKPI